MGDLILKMIGAGAVVFICIFIGLMLTGGSIEIRNTRTGKTKRWGKKD